MRTDQGYRKTCQRYNTAGHAHELTFSCYKQRPFLRTDRTRTYLAEAIIQAKENHRFDLWAYVIMPDHVHLLIWPRNDTYSISHILLSIKQSVARRAIHYLHTHNPAALQCLATGQKHSPYRFWQDGGGFDRNILCVPAVMNVVEYIHNNPVRRGLVSTPEEWLWSSARQWHEDPEGPIPIDRESFPS